MRVPLIILFLLAFGSAQAQNLFLNGSFENFLGSCSNASPNGAVNNDVIDWFTTGPDTNYGFASADLYCGQANYIGCMPGPPLVGSDGAVYIGFHSSDLMIPYNEAVYQTLATPLTPGQTYYLSLDLMTCQNGIMDGSDDFFIYSNIDDNLALCPLDSPSVQLLGTIPHSAVSNTGWQNHQLEFVAPTNCNVIIFSSVCSGDNTYYYLDNLILSDSCIIQIDIGADTTLCEGESLMLDATMPNATYQWQDNSTAATFQVTQPGTYFVRVSDTCGSTTDTIVVEYDALPAVSLGNDTTLCLGNNYTIDVTDTNASNYLWSTTSTDPSFTISQADTYWVQLTNDCGISSDTITVQYDSIPTFNLGPDTILCQGSSIQLDASASGVLPVWQDTTSSFTYNVSTAGLYWAELTVNCGSFTDSILVEYYPPLAVELGNDTTICSGDAVFFDVTTQFANYLWSDNSSNPMFAINADGTYWVQLTDSCTSTSDTITVATEPCDVLLQMPNVFTPNFDGINDRFAPEVQLGIASMYTEIYNRWGSLIYKTNKLEIGWDGHPFEDGVYFYQIDYTDIFGASRRVAGSFTLIR